jgi:hypothetical protein
MTRLNDDKTNNRIQATKVFPLKKFIFQMMKLIIKLLIFIKKCIIGTYMDLIATLNHRIH